MSPDMEGLLEQWREAWPLARDTWNSYVKLRDPEWCFNAEEAERAGLKSSFAMIRLTDHRIVINLEEIQKYKLEGFGREILAHEIGHHIFTPANLHDNATLLSGIRWGLPGIEDRAPFVANLYADLLINDYLQKGQQLNMAEVYRHVNKGLTFSRSWTFYMRTFEYLWRLDRGDLTSDYTFQSGQIDADATLAASLIRSYARKWQDGAGRFATLWYPYLMEEKEYQQARKSMILHLDAEQAGEGGGMVTGLTELDAGGIGGSIDPRGEALGNNHGEVGLPDVQAKGEGPQQRYLNPGQYVDLFRQVNPQMEEQEIINHYYKEIALPHLVSFPLEHTDPRSDTLPEGTESWDVSDPIEEIDWIETAIIAPNIFPGYNTVKRIYGSDQSEPEVQKPSDVYLGIDCSGSMGNPKLTFSWPVLAATIIGLSALRVGARVKACLSGEPGSFMETDGFRTLEREVLTVLTSYLGTGYSFGIPRLLQPFDEPQKKKSHIILVTDDDIFSMLHAEVPDGEESNWSIIERTLLNAGGVGTLVLHSRAEWHSQEAERLRKMGWHIYYVTNEEELLVFASGFSKDHYTCKK